MIYTRTLGEEKLLVLCNFKEKEKCIALPEGWRLEQMTRLIGNYPEPESGNENPPRPENGDAAELHLDVAPAYSFSGENSRASRLRNRFITG